MPHGLVPGGSFEVFVDTVQDGPASNASLDPAVRVRDGQGTSLANDDDGVACSVPQVCGYSCPFVQGACGAGNSASHSERERQRVAPISTTK